MVLIVAVTAASTLAAQVAVSPVNAFNDRVRVEHRSAPQRPTPKLSARQVSRRHRDPPGPVPALPGAQGGGALSRGGRGGEVYQVTNLSDSGIGSLRVCIEAKGPRTCIFRTGGTITLASSLFVANPFITIAGQTAPGDRIHIAGPNPPDGHSLYITTHDVVIRYLRIRRGWYEGERCTSTCATNVLILANHA